MLFADVGSRDELLISFLGEGGGGGGYGEIFTSVQSSLSVCWVSCTHSFGALHFIHTCMYNSWQSSQL